MCQAHGHGRGSRVTLMNGADLIAVLGNLLLVRKNGEDASQIGEPDLCGGLSFWKESR